MDSTYTIEFDLEFNGGRVEVFGGVGADHGRCEIRSDGTVAWSPFTTSIASYNSPAGAVTPHVKTTVRLIRWLGTAHVIVNGVLVRSANYSGAEGLRFYLKSLYRGRNSTNSGKLLLTKFRLWNGTNPTDANLAFSTDFDEDYRGDGYTLTDKSGNGRHFTAMYMKDESVSEYSISDGGDTFLGEEKWPTEPNYYPEWQTEWPGIVKNDRNPARNPGLNVYELDNYKRYKFRTNATVDANKGGQIGILGQAGWHSFYPENGEYVKILQAKDHYVALIRYTGTIDFSMYNTSLRRYISNDV